MANGQWLKPKNYEKSQIFLCHCPLHRKECNEQRNKKSEIFHNFLALAIGH